MEVSVAVAGGDTETVEVPHSATYADLLEPLPYSIHEVTVLVDGRPVAEDAPIDSGVDRVRVVRLVQGG